MMIKNMFTVSFYMVPKGWSLHALLLELAIIAKCNLAISEWDMWYHPLSL